MGSALAEELADRLFHALTAERCRPAYIITAATQLPVTMLLECHAACTRMGEVSGSSAHGWKKTTRKPCHFVCQRQGDKGWPMSLKGLGYHPQDPLLTGWLITTPPYSTSLGEPHMERPGPSVADPLGTTRPGSALLHISCLSAASVSPPRQKHWLRQPRCCF